MQKKKKIIIIVAIALILCIVAFDITTSIINNRNYENSKKELQEKIDFVNNTYNDMRDTRNIFYNSLVLLNEKNETFKLQIDEMNNSIDIPNNESNPKLDDLIEKQYFFEIELDLLKEMYEDINSQIENLTYELSNVEFDKLSINVHNSLNNWADNKIKINNRLESVNERADALEALINTFNKE